MCRCTTYRRGAHLSTPETCPTGEAHSSVVSTTPISGSTRVNFLTALGNSSFSVTPAMVGTSTTWNVDSASPCVRKSTYRHQVLPRMSTKREMNVLAQRGQIVRCFACDMQGNTREQNTWTR